MILQSLSEKSMAMQRFETKYSNLTLTHNQTKILPGFWEERNKASRSENPNGMHVFQTQLVENTNVVTGFFKEERKSNKGNQRYYDEKFLKF